MNTQFCLAYLCLFLNLAFSFLQLGLPYLTQSPSASPLFLHFQVERKKGRCGDGMASFLKATHFIHSNNKLQNHPFSPSNTQTLKISTSRKPLMAALSTTATVGLSQTFTRLKEQGKVSHSTPHSSPPPP